MSENDSQRRIWRLIAIIALAWALGALTILLLAATG